MNTMTQGMIALAAWVAAGTTDTRAASLLLGDAQPITETQATTPVRLAGSNAVVAMQFDVAFPSTLVSLVLPELKLAAPSYRMTSRELAAGLTRVVVYSAPNTALPQNLIVDLTLGTQPGTNASDVVLTVSNLWFADMAGVRIPASPSYGPVTNWKRLTFTPDERQNPGISGDASDPERDGLPNLVEMLLQGRAKFADPAKVPVLGAELNSQDSRWHLTLTYRKSKTAQGVVGEVQASTDLITWPVIVPSVPTGSEDATTIEMQASILLDGPQQFLRLRAKRTGSP